MTDMAVNVCVTFAVLCVVDNMYAKAFNIMHRDMGYVFIMAVVSAVVSLVKM